ncbi:MAG TPA: hypothetical protein VGP92_13885 [Acidimicrobiia bacterium]|nr:hypothetical protein [Acidimicrobiia bacterium]
MTITSLAESGAYALLLAGGLGLVAFGLFTATDAIENDLDRQDRELAAAGEEAAEPRR